MRHVAAVTDNGRFLNRVGVVSINSRFFHNSRQAVDNSRPCRRICTRVIRLADNKPAVCINTRDDSRIGIYLSTAQFRAIRVICLLPESDLDFFRTRAVLIIMVVPDLLHGQLDSFLAGIFFVSGIRHQTLVICRCGCIRH